MDWTNIKDATVVFHDFDGRPNYEGMVSVCPSWIYLHENDTYIPSDNVAEVAGPDSNRFE